MNPFKILKTRRLLREQGIDDLSRDEVKSFINGQSEILTDYEGNGNKRLMSVGSDDYLTAKAIKEWRSNNPWANALDLRQYGKDYRLETLGDTNQDQNASNIYWDQRLGQLVPLLNKLAELNEGDNNKYEYKSTSERNDIREQLTLYYKNEADALQAAADLLIQEDDDVELNKNDELTDINLPSIDYSALNKNLLSNWNREYGKTGHSFSIVDGNDKASFDRNLLAFGKAVETAKKEGNKLTLNLRMFGRNYEDKLADMTQELRDMVALLDQILESGLEKLQGGLGRFRSYLSELYGGKPVSLGKARDLRNVLLRLLQGREANNRGNIFKDIFRGRSEIRGMGRLQNFMNNNSTIEFDGQTYSAPFREGLNFQTARDVMDKRSPGAYLRWLQQMQKNRQATDYQKLWNDLFVGSWDDKNWKAENGKLYSQSYSQWMLDYLGKDEFTNEAKNLLQGTGNFDLNGINSWEDLMNNEEQRNKITGYKLSSKIIDDTNISPNLKKQLLTELYQRGIISESDYNYKLKSIGDMSSWLLRAGYDLASPVWNIYRQNNRVRPGLFDEDGNLLKQRNGGILYKLKYQNGGSMEDQNQLQELMMYGAIGVMAQQMAQEQQQDPGQLIPQIVQAVQLQDLQIMQSIQLIMQQVPPEQLMQTGQLVVLMMQLSLAQMARLGAKISYIKQLSSGCPDGYELVYFKKGGLMCKVCRQKALMKACDGKVKKKQSGGQVDPKRKYFDKSGNKIPKRGC